MRMTNRRALAVALGLASLCTSTVAEQLPKSGIIKVHTGFKVSPDVTEVGEKRMQGHGSSVGVSFNDSGSGPLHAGPISCFWAFFASDNSSKVKGYCAFGDADSDRLYTDWSGASSGSEGTAGRMEIVGGTGKYSGIQGDGQFKCQMVGPNGQETCMAQLNYRLP